MILKFNKIIILLSQYISNIINFVVLIMMIDWIKNYDSLQFYFYNSKKYMRDFNKVYLCQCVYINFKLESSKQK